MLLDADADTLFITLRTPRRLLLFAAFSDAMVAAATCALFTLAATPQAL